MSSPLALPYNADAELQSRLLHLLDILDGIDGALLATTCIAVGLRTYVRAKVTKTFGWDDSTMITSQLIYIITCIVMFVAVNGMRQLINTGHGYTVPTLLQLIRYSNVAYVLTMMTVKISIAIFFLKLFAKSYRWQRILIITATAATTAMAITYIVFTVATCGVMIQSQKTTPYKTGTDWCPIQQVFVNFSIAWSFFNTLCDLLYAILAVQLICGAKMSKSAKISAACLVAFGCVGGLASIGRIAVQLPVGDVRVNGVLLGIWSNAEAGITITAASLITLRPLAQSALERAKSSFGSLKASSGFSKHSFGKSADTRSTTSSTKDVMEMIDCDGEGAPRDKLDVTVTRTWEVREKDQDSWSRKSSV